MKKFDHEIVSGGIFRSIWKVAWPVVVTQLIAGVHGMIDQALVGHQDGFEGQAAVGASWQLFLVVVVFLSMFFQGMNILIAQYVGRQDSAGVNRIAYHTFLASAYILTFIVAPLGYVLTPYLLRLVDVSDSVAVYAEPYLRILFVVNAPLFFMFLLGGALQSSGNAKIPLVLGVTTAVVHTAISFVLINGIGPFPELGTIGAAVGTVLGSVPSVAIAIWLIMTRRVFVGPPDKFTLVPDLTILKRSAAIGFPTGIQAVLLNVGGAALIFFINQLPMAAAALAAYTICYTQLFNFVTWTGFGLRAACATVIGQNIGAGKLARGERAVYWGAAIGLVWAIVFGVMYWTIPGPLLAIFDLGSEPEVSELARQFLQFLSFSGICVVVMLAITGGLQGAGDTKTPMYIAFVTQIGILLGVCFAALRLDALTPTLIWSAILTSHVTRLLLTYVVFARGRWRSIKVSLHEPVRATTAGIDPAPEAAQDAARGA
jgi:putative MATE family efflux protein